MKDTSDLYGTETNGRIINEADKNFALHHYKEAITDYTHALRLTPNSALILKKRADAFLRLKSYKDAIEDYKHAVVVKTLKCLPLPTVLHIYKNRATALMGLGEYEQAVDDFGKFTQLFTGPVYDPNKKSFADDLAVDYEHEKSAMSYQIALTNPIFVLLLDLLEYLIKLILTKYCNKKNTPNETSISNALLKIHQYAQSSSLEFSKNEEEMTKILFLIDKVLPSNNKGQCFFLNCASSNPKAALHRNKLYKMYELSIEGSVCESPINSDTVNNEDIPSILARIHVPQTQAILTK